MATKTVTKQEEIREVLNTLCCVAKAKDLSKSSTGYDDEVGNAMWELDDLGVVIKVERAKSPDDLVATEPLIKE